MAHDDLACINRACRGKSGNFGMIGYRIVGNKLAQPKAFLGVRRVEHVADRHVFSGDQNLDLFSAVTGKRLRSLLVDIGSKIGSIRKYARDAKNAAQRSDRQVNTTPHRNPFIQQCEPA